MEVRFPNGTTVRASGIRERVVDDPARDFGLYLDAAWAPSWPAAMIDWPDFGVPADGDAAASAIRAAFERARAGERVEVGCRAGLGRTGTVLACMAILAGVATDEAVAWVRTAYRPDAVETLEQEAWVRWFGGQSSS